jgi:hypothetical protein
MSAAEVGAACRQHACREAAHRSAIVTAMPGWFRRVPVGVDLARLQRRLAGRSRPAPARSMP